MGIGKVIRYHRKSNKITQKQLGGRFHSDSHVSDIERGLVFPSHKTLIDFSNILGVNLTQYLEYVEADDPIAVKALIEEAIDLVKAYQYTEANKLIQSHIEKDAYFKTSAGQLVAAKYEAIYLSREKKLYKQAVDVLKYALLDNKVEHIGYLEIDLINNIGTMFTMDGDLKNAQVNFEKAYEHLKKLTLIEDKRLQASVLYNLSRIHIDLEDYNEVKRYSDELIHYCVDNEYTYMLAKAYYNKGVAEIELDDQASAIGSFKSAYYMFLALNQGQNAEMLLSYTKDHYGINLLSQ